MSHAAAKRPTERILLSLVTIIVATGFVLVYLGKTVTTPPIVTGDVNINTASAPVLAGLLGVDMQIGQSVVNARARKPGGQFESVASLRSLSAISRIPIIWQPQHMYVRTPGESLRWFVRGSLLFLIAFWIMHLILSQVAPGADQLMVPMVALLAGIGLIMVYSTKDPWRDTFTFLNQMRGIVIFGFASVLVPFTPYFRKLRLHRYGFAYGMGAFTLMLLLMILGHGPGSVKIEVFGFQPIEFMKVLLVFFVACFLAERRISLGASPSHGFLADLPDVVPLAALYFIVLMLFLVIKDLGPAVLLFGTFAAMLYLATGRKTYPALAGLLLLIAGVIGYAVHIGFFATRVLMWLHPWSSNDGKTGQLAMGLWGVATGGVFGSGIGLGMPASVPRAGSDMVFTSIGEEMGLIGGLTVLVAICAIVWRGFRIARNAVDDFDRFLAAGLTFLLGLQAFVITAGTTGLLPLTGITLPFVSYGSSSLVADFFSIGVLLYISRKRLPEAVPSSVPSFYASASRTTATILTAALLLGVGAGRLVWLQSVRSDDIATNLLWIPDADGIVRAHQNPRLMVAADQIPRGRILDSSGHILADNPSLKRPGVSYLCGRPRVYPYGEIGANLVLAAEQPSSPTNPIGCDSILRGYSSQVELLDRYRSKDLPWHRTIAGKDAKLTIRIDLQRAAQDALANAAIRYGTGAGAAVALDPKTGSLLAAATYPTFNPNTLDDDTWNRLHNGGMPSKPLLNRPFAGVYTPGSAFKLVTATAALNAGAGGFRANCDHVLDNVHWRVGPAYYSRAHITDEAGFPPHGDVDLSNGLKVSCNVYFAQLGIHLGPKPLYDTMGLFQLSHRSSYAAIGEDLPDCAYGQGTDSVTVLEMARVAQAIANNGSLEPKRYLASTPSTGIATQVMTADSSQALESMMRGVVTGGTARGVFDGLQTNVYGKTGSAQVNGGAAHSWFVGFAGVDSPSIAFACVVEHGGAGRTAAAPVCRAIVAESTKLNPR